MTDRLTTLKSVLWALVGVLAAVTVVRFAHGLGAVTHLSDAAPWGLWIGFDVMSGVALAAGGFVLAATVYVFGLERYRPFVRPAVLTALLGYSAVAVGLLYDLGLPWRIWHPALHWQYRSVLFEVAMCVMLYLTVLALEFAPAVLEHPLFSGRVFRTALGALKKATIPLVITGIVLSTLHQSSLGSLFLITPYRLHPLWYSHFIYLFFFVSAVGLGLMMVVLESLLSSYFLGHRVHTRELGGLGAAASAVLWLYVALRVGDLWHRGVLGMAVDGSTQGTLFLFEMGVSAVVPATLLLFRRVRSTLGGMGLSAALTVTGMVLYRLDVSILSFARPEGFGYFPSWEEFAVSAGIVSAFALVFIFFAERLKVYDDVGPAPSPRPSFDPATPHGLLPPRLAAPRRYSAVALAGAVVALAFLPVKGVEPVRVPVSAARTVDGLALDGGIETPRSLRFAAEAGAEASDTTLLLMIDGNRNGTLVLFDHDDHAARLGADTACATCHHMSLPLDRNTPCAACHRDMYDTTSVFDHDVHVEALEGNAGCVECHAGTDGAKTTATATACEQCHAGEVRPSRIVAAPQERWRAAASYTDAMHGLCVTCHRQTLEEEAGDHPPGLAECRACHDADRPTELAPLTPSPDGSAGSAASERTDGPPAGEET
ncbi:MAG TPA: Ni/Fe-hydrogenase cytochrome b subunit [Longimicrobiales bacterium]|nr:Ni/Fe-hydrogenase cytochrome b subunit [Longimicrobiales bacterium]